MLWSRRIFPTLLLCLFVLGLATTVLEAQVSRGTLSGLVTDADGAVVPAAHLTATDTATGANYSAVSSSDGQYTIPFLAPGTYRVTATAAGFKSTVHQNVLVAANEHVRVDMTMAVGTRTEMVTVSADNTMLDTSMASTGQVLDQEDIENMPVNGRTPMILAQLAYGALSTGNPQFNHPFDNSGPSSISLGGGASKKNEILIDGSPDGGADGTLAFSPPMDAMQEVKVETFQADAAYGHTSGGTINHVTRSGTNEYHGSLYEFLQVSALNDTPYFNKHVAGTPKRKSVTRFNQWGGTIGMPLSIPHVYDARNKLFLFFAYEGISDNTPSPSILTVPTDAERKGDFSALLPLGYVIYDPATGVKGSNGRIQRKAFPGNIIPQQRLNQVGMNLASYFAEPNIPAGKPDGESNYFYPGNSTDKFDSEMGRIDANVSEKDKAYFAFRHNDRYHQANNAFNNIATGSVLIQPNWGATLDEIHMFSANTIWENRFNWSRNTESRPLAASFDFSKLGFPPALAAASTTPGFPVTSGTKFVDFGYSKGDYIPYDSFQYFSMVSHTMGKHSLSFGADLRLSKEYSFRYGNSSGLYQFSLNKGQGWTNGPFDNSGAATIGQEFASMLLGLPTAGSFDINGKQISQAKYYAFFVQDNYRLLKNLTLNLGLRYERDLPTTERNNEGVIGFDASATNPINAQAQENFAANPVSGVNFPSPLTGGLVFASANHRGMYQTTATNFSPRIGFAYSRVTTMSLRGGFGIFNNSVGRMDPIATGFNQTTQLQASLDGYLTPNGTLSDPFPTGLILPPGGSLGLQTNLGQAVSFYPSKVLNDYAERWNLDFQQQLLAGVLFEVGYVGEHGVHVGVSRNIDYVPAQYLNVGQSRNPAVYANLTANVANPFKGIANSAMNGSTTTRQQLLMTYPQFTSVMMSGFPAGNSLFHALEARVEKRMSGGVRFLVNYEWSKRLERVAYLNPQDSAPEKRISSDDRPQHLVASGTWELPFGQGRRYRVGVPVAGYLASGWNLTSIFTYQPQGAPLSWGDVIYKGTSLNNLRVNPHAPDGAFDVTQFDRVSGDQPVTGTHIRTLPTQVAHARQDGIVALDMSLIKNNRITERVNAQLRADFFNALNHPSFSAPNLSPTSSAFGTITSQANLPRTIQLGVRVAF
ncbi:carboxypeptidase regulatory-like domain-containing protein [Edaphobacter sp.]|uniref:carboxypeptidase regulatory-like domain-containing protein n=1 Tax=Edaphobacter sp. TaxID=1934404 RepID=UPI002DB967C6|nr:carboxypeptidase regulatory-like domain-containing protein [Edaphobacter sp.]HEU5342399.1 carboxypeptidase regulatory-like domain-containing protein [Edaphobacter sp.]